MTISLKGNAQGGVVDTNGVPAANITSGTGIPFMKNKLINGEVTRINQRGVANWSAVSNGAYGYDRWKKIDASNMTQIIEAGNFRPSTVHTLSGVGVTTQQITSPASGDWTLPNIPITATNVQVEEGLEATPFEVRPIGFELALCQRYYLNMEAFVIVAAGTAGIGQPVTQATYCFPVEMRAQPTLNVVPANGINIGGIVTNASKKAIRSTGTAVAAGYVYADFTHYWASAEL